MKKTWLSLLILVLSASLSAQEVKILGSYAHTNYYDKFENTFGYGIGYNYIKKSKNKLGLMFYHSFNHDQYQYTYISDAEGASYPRDVVVKNQRMTLSVYYAVNIIFNGKKSNFYIGPELGWNFFKINEERKETKTNDPTYYKEYHSLYGEMGKFGLGFILEYEQLISNKISLSLSTHPEIILFSIPGLKGSDGPVIAPWIGFNLGVQYKLDN
ncbi:MAG: hypothetical protein GQ527_09270 [Bacteroidales bacterium]|nr:hypothetical protein [Bacteroidales bacterium]